MTWQDTLRAELDEMPPVDQFVAAGRWIADMTQILLPELGARRRAALLSALETMDAVEFAETIGARPGTIERLATEARTQRRKATPAKAISQLASAHPSL